MNGADVKKLPIAFENFETKNFLNSFYDIKFNKNKKKQMIDLKKYIKNWNSKKFSFNNSLCCYF